MFTQQYYKKVLLDIIEEHLTDEKCQECNNMFVDYNVKSLDEKIQDIVVYQGCCKECKCYVYDQYRFFIKN